MLPHELDRNRKFLIETIEVGSLEQYHQLVRFLQFWPGASGSCLIHVATHFDNSVRELTNLSTSNIKGGNSDNNGSDLDKGDNLKPAFDT
jgi:hypothetical protein